MKNLIDAFLPIDDQEELEIFLSNRYSHQIQRSQFNVWGFGGIVTLRYNRRQKLQAIYCSKNEEIAGLLNAYKNATAEGETGSYSEYIFFKSPVNGFFRYENKFQIIPTIELAPKPPFSLADHPALLQITYKQSSDPYINRHRVNQKIWKIKILLASLIKGGVRHKDISTSHVWAIALHGDSPSSSGYFQKGYFAPLDERPLEPDFFFSTAGIAHLPIMPYLEYYSQTGFTTDDMQNLVLPSSLVDTVGIFYSLNEKMKSEFLMSGYWSQMSREITTISQSAAYTCLVSAVEVFLPTSQNPKDKWYLSFRKGFLQMINRWEEPAGPTKEFRILFDKYAPEVPIKTRNEFYNVRSSLSHGNRLLDRDMPGNDSISAIYNSENDMFPQLSVLVRTIQFNWLLKSSETHSET